MTVHSAKGLEYKFVYIVGLEENLFPSQRAVESPDGFEEERRLFYVALTRAKELATLSYAEMRFKWGNMEFSRPSCFLREIDSRYLETDAMQEGVDIRKYSVIYDAIEEVKAAMEGMLAPTLKEQITATIEVREIGRASCRERV